MPRVSDEYIDLKKKNIVDAALRTCEKKTVSSVTMQDIINESGLSQGGIYRFYPHIDAILAAVLDDIHIKLSMNELIANYDSTKYSPSENINNIWMLICEHIKSNLSLHKTHSIQIYYLLS